jgi:hypothetical protein
MFLFSLRFAYQHFADTVGVAGEDAVVPRVLLLGANYGDKVIPHSLSNLLVRYVWLL